MQRSPEDREALSPPREVRGRRCGRVIRRSLAGREQGWAGCRLRPLHQPGCAEKGAGGLGGGEGPAAATCSVRETKRAAKMEGRGRPGARPPWGLGRSLPSGAGGARGDPRGTAHPGGPLLVLALRMTPGSDCRSSQRSHGDWGTKTDCSGVAVVGAGHRASRRRPRAKPLTGGWNRFLLRAPDGE